MTAILNIENKTNRHLTLSNTSTSIGIQPNSTAQIDLSKCSCCQITINDKDETLWKGYLPVPESIKIKDEDGDLKVYSNDQVFPSLYKRCKWWKYTLYILAILILILIIFLIYKSI